MIRPAARTTLYKEVIGQILDMIKQGEWKQGGRIPGEIELAQKFEVSRNCVREALKALGHAGVLESKPGLGTFLSKDALRSIQTKEMGQLLRDETSLAELLEARLIIEPQLVKIASERATEEDIARLETAVKRAMQAVRTNTYSVQIGLEFHMLMAQIAGNRVIMRLFSSIADELRVQRRVLILSHMSKEGFLRELREHSAILACIKRRDGGRASELLTAHLTTAMRVLTEAQARKLPLQEARPAEQA
jgi:GntR family transcriptional regulator, transcriptional repressor for pyruvate dehydrogenase complex